MQLKRVLGNIEEPEQVVVSVVGVAALEARGHPAGGTVVVQDLSRPRQAAVGLPCVCVACQVRVMMTLPQLTTPMMSFQSSRRSAAWPSNAKCPQNTSGGSSCSSIS